MKRKKGGFGDYKNKMIENIYFHINKCYIIHDKWVFSKLLVAYLRVCLNS